MQGDSHQPEDGAGVHHSGELRIEVALIPGESVYARIAQVAVEAAGATLVPADLASANDVVGRLLIVDLTRVLVAGTLGRRVIAISHRAHPDCYDVIPPDEVAARLPRALHNLIEVERLRERVTRERETVRQLNEIGLSLSTITDTDELLARILALARRTIPCDGGTIYLRSEDDLRFAAAQNDTIEFRPWRDRLPISEESLSGYVASRRELLRIDDVLSVPTNAPYHPNSTNDHRLGYQTRSAMLVPMLDRDNSLLGVMALFNRKTLPGVPIANFDRVLPFSAQDEELARSIASQAAVALESHRLYRDIRKLFDGFVTAAVTVIEARDPSTAGHSHRVARLTTALARACSDSDHREFARVRFNETELEELHYAAMLHDFGKVGVPEHVLLKADKLYPWELDRVEDRFRLAALQTRLEALRNHQEQDARERLRVLDDDLGLVRRMNRSGYRVSEDELRRLQAISARWWLEEPAEPVLQTRDVQRLCIPRGSLDADERRAIELHVTHTYNFLRVIPWTRQLSRVPDLAHAHHEKLDGSGYPRGLRGDDIPYGAKLMTITDIFDALTAGDRPYKVSMGLETAVRILREEADAQHIERAAVELFVAKRLWEGIIDARVD